VRLLRSQGTPDGEELTLATKTVAPALKALLHGLIDYAGTFPPAQLPLDKVVSNYGEYRASDYAWMLRYLVVDGRQLAELPKTFDGLLSVLGKTDDNRAATIETSEAIESQHPVYCEVSLENISAALDKVKASKCFAKVRAGGVTPEAIPSTQAVAAFILGCADRKLPFKATAGLHHAVRGEYALTYEANAPRAVMHGFLNVLMASTFAWTGLRDIEAIIGETEPDAFAFGDDARWRDLHLTIDQLREARENFIHSIGSCSFEEPIQDLQTLGFL
jgi:hypothetical protein